MIIFAQIGSQKRLHSQTNAVHDNAEFNQADHYRQRDLPRFSIAGRDVADQYIVRHRPAEINRRVNDTKTDALHQIGHGQMPDEMQCVALSEEVPEGGQKPQRIADDRPQDDAEHSEAARQQHRKQDIPADLAGITDIVAGLVSVGIDHLAQIRDHDVERRVQRRPAVIDGRQVVDFAADPADPEIDIPEQH